ncbi:MAG: hypothetical protein ACKO2P_19800 [Planctomycetota bacterium]
MPSPRPCVALLLSLFCIQYSCIALACGPALPIAPPSRDTVSDRVFLQDGTVLRGLLVSERPLRLLIRTEWLTEHAQEFLASQLRPLLQQHTSDSRAALTSLLQKELREIPAAPVAADAGNLHTARRALLEDLLERLVPEDPLTLPDWLLVECPRTRVQRLEQVPDERRNLCRLGMLNRLPQLEQLPWKTVQRQLEAIPADQRITVFHGPPPGHSDDAQDLFQRILVAVDVRAGAAARVIQAGPLCVDEASSDSISVLFQQALQQNLQSTVSELLAEVSGTGPAAPAPAAPVAGSIPAEAIAIARRQGSRTLVISSSQSDLSTGTAVVSRQVFLQCEGEWRRLFVLQEQASVRDIPADRARQLADDPQIQQLNQIVQTLGIGDNQLQTALNMGGVVQEALARLQARFDEQLQWLLTARWTSAAGIPLVVLENSAPPKPAQAQ